MSMIPLSVMGFIKTLRPPCGCFIPTKMLQEIKFEDGYEIRPASEHNVDPALTGIVVQYLTACLSTSEPWDKILCIPLRGLSSYDMSAEFFGHPKGLRPASPPYDISAEAAKLFENPHWDDWNFVVHVIRTVTEICCYERVFRVEIPPVPWKEPDPSYYEDVWRMVIRSRNFLSTQKPIRASEFTIDKRTSKICCGDGDFITEDAIIDFKTLKGNFTPQMILQQVIYSLLTDHKVEKVILFNPRKNLSGELRLSDIPEDIMQRIKSEISYDTIKIIPKDKSRSNNVITLQDFWGEDN